MTLSVPKVKLFFSKTAEKMEEIMKQMEIDGAIEEEVTVEDYSLKDL